MALMEGIGSPLRGSGFHPAVAGTGAQNGAAVLSNGVLVQISRHGQIKNPAQGRVFYLWRW